MEYDTPLPRYREILIVVSAVEETFNVVDQSLLHILVHDDIFPACILH